MSEVHELQKNLQRIQQDREQVSTLFAKIVNSKPGYKAVVEMRKEPMKCTKCGHIREGQEKFCPECGTKTELKN